MILLALVGLTTNFVIALVLVVVWAMLFAVEGRSARPISTG